VVALIAVAALRWVLADGDRSRRLTGIIGAWRGTRHRPSAADQEDFWETLLSGDGSRRV
jgi:hypothetical protein